MQKVEKWVKRWKMADVSIFEYRQFEYKMKESLQNNNNK